MSAATSRESVRRGLARSARLPTIDTHPFPLSAKLQAAARLDPAGLDPARLGGLHWRGYLAIALLAALAGAGAGVLGGTFAGGANPGRDQPVQARPDQAQPIAQPPGDVQASAATISGSGVELGLLAQEIAAVREEQQRLLLGLRLLPGGPPQTESLRARLAALEAAPALDANAQGARAGAALDLRIAALEKAVSDLTRQHGTARSDLARLESRARLFAPEAEVAALRVQVARLNEDLIASRSEAAAAGRAARGAFAVAAAAEAAQRSGPFVEATRTLAAAFPEDKQVQALAALAVQGAPSRAELQASFAALDERIDRALRAAAGGPGLLGSMQAALSQQVSVKPVAPKGAPRNPLDSARAAIAKGDLAGAVTALGQLDGQAALEARAWLDGARRRLEIDARLAAIRAELLKG